jgi:hypothetical protein
VLVSDPAELADLDAAELASSQQLIHLVATNVQDLGRLLDCVRLDWPRLLPVTLGDASPIVYVYASAP